jgi:hypothetical protein
MVSSGKLCHVALVRADILEVLSCSKMSVLTRAIQRNIPEDAILHSHHRENLKSYKYLVSYTVKTWSSHAGLHA